LSTIVEASGRKEGRAARAQNLNSYYQGCFHRKHRCSNIFC